MLADATTRMVEAARLCASNPNDIHRQNTLRRAVEDLRIATTQAATPALRRKLLTRLEVRLQYSKIILPFYVKKNKRLLFTIGGCQTSSKCEHSVHNCSTERWSKQSVRSFPRGVVNRLPRASGCFASFSGRSKRLTRRS